MTAIFDPALIGQTISFDCCDAVYSGHVIQGEFRDGVFVGYTVEVEGGHQFGGVYDLGDGSFAMRARILQ
jgi:hypothetical protein